MSRTFAANSFPDVARGRETLPDGGWDQVILWAHRDQLAGVRATAVSALEIMVATHAVRNLVRKGEDHQIYTAIATGRAEGMITMEQSLADMVRAGRIGRETAMAHCFRSEDLRRYLQE